MVPLKLDLHSLLVFYQVARAGSVTAAADAMCLTQPTVTYHIRSLERNCGVKLIDIKRQKVALTQAGEGLLVYAAQVYRKMADADRYLENLKETSYRVGVSMTFCNSLLPVVARFQKRYPNMKLIIRSAPSGEVREDVLNSEVDIGVVVGTEESDPRFRTVTLSASERLVLVAAPQNPLARRKRIELTSLCGHPLVLGPDTSATRQMILRQLRAGGCGAPSPVLVEVNNSDWGINLVENGQGVGLHHVCSVRKSIQSGRLRVLPLVGELRVRADAVLRADAPEHPVTDTFINLVSAALKRAGKELPAVPAD